MSMNSYRIVDLTNSFRFLPTHVRSILGGLLSYPLVSYCLA